MGLLDSYLDDPQQAGLLNAAAQMLAASGPSTMPRSFGQVLASGIGGFQQGASQANQRAEQAQLRQLNGLKIQDAASDLKNQELARQEQERLRQFYMGQGQGGATPMPAPQSAASSFADAMQGQPQQQPAQPQAGGANTGIYQQRLALAQKLRDSGFAKEADAQEAAALKFQPKVKGWEKVQQGGKVMFAPFFEDGTSGAPVPLEVAEKLEKINRGGTTDLANPYTGAVVSSLKNTISPDAAAANGIANQRLTLDKERLDYEKGQGKIPAGYRATADGGLEAIPGGPAADKITSPQQKLSDAKDVLDLLKQAKPLVETATGSYGGALTDAGARFFGKSTEGADAAAQLSALEGMLVSKMPKMSGPQSDKDVAMYKQMAGRIGDPTIPKDTKLAAMETIRQINQRYVDAAQVKPERKVATLADIAATAKASGKSTAEVTAALRAKGYTIGGK